MQDLRPERERDSELALKNPRMLDGDAVLGVPTEGGEVEARGFPVVLGKDGAGQSVECLDQFVGGHVRHGNTRHGRSRTPEYVTWTSIKQRCYNPKATGYEDYGGRGIKVCERWRTSFEAFLADVGLRPAGLTFDRINNDGNYEPGNVRWATMAQQAANKRPVRRSVAIKRR